MIHEFNGTVGPDSPVVFAVDRHELLVAAGDEPLSAEPHCRHDCCLLSTWEMDRVVVRGFGLLWLKIGKNVVRCCPLLYVICLHNKLTCGTTLYTNKTTRFKEEIQTILQNKKYAKS